MQESRYRKMGFTLRENRLQRIHKFIFRLNFLLRKGLGQSEHFFLEKSHRLC